MLPSKLGDMGSSTETVALLSGVRIVELTQYLPGPFCAQTLADLGADVVKVEPPQGDPMCGLPPLDEDGVSPFYKLWNAGKRVVRLDLKAADGLAALKELIARADVLLESYRPGALARLGLDRGTLQALNPQLVHCALSGYGQTGPLAGAAGHDNTYMALGGGLIASGPPERPAMAYPPVADYAGALQAALAISAALVRQARTGQGAHLDVSLMESVLAWQAGSLTQTARGMPPERARELLNGGVACYNLYRCADGRWVALGALEPHFWRAFCDALGRDDWTGRQWEPMPQRALICELAALFESADLDHWVRTLEGVDCCVQPLLTFAELLNHPHLDARGLVQRDGDLVQVLAPVLTDGAAPSPRRPHDALDASALDRIWRTSA
jgi:crotonobetainyl-CoA:carnitine CoA-transferase CaiB-like acyl-CoA transferase